ncbi:MAG: DUF4339 domain-containing protein [Planctomycetes bacterium]|nr:DUF4339 domain-containing protein [Planctomycetota bacterium]
MASDGAEVLGQLIVMGVFGGICAAIAQSRGRNPVGWFFIGAVLPCIGLVLVLALPDLTLQQAHEARHRRRTRRLEEQLELHRHASDRRHAEVERRLDAHDQALGMDTAEPEQLTAAAPPPPLPGGAREWFYAIDGKQEGPVDEDRIRQLWDQRLIDLDTLVWTAGMSDWSPLRRATTLRESIGA